MPDHHTLNRVLSRIAIIGLAALSAWCILSNIATSGLPGNYRYYHDWLVHPMAGVLAWSAVIAIETAVACGVLWRARSVVAASLTLALFLGTALIVLGPYALASPPYQGAHLIFLFFATTWLVLIALAGGIAGRARASKPRRVC